MCFCLFKPDLTSGSGSPHLFVLLHVPDLHLTPQVPEPGQNQDVTLRTETKKNFICKPVTVQTLMVQTELGPLVDSPVVGGVPWSSSEVEYRVAFNVEDSGLGRHEAVHHTELRRVRTPDHVVDRTVLRCFREKTTNRTELYRYCHSLWCQNVVLVQLTQLDQRRLAVHSEVMQCLLAII